MVNQGTSHEGGITSPSIDDLLTKSDSKYGLVLFAAKRARQINAYYAQLGEGLLQNVGPLVDHGVQEKPLSIALREIDSGVLVATPSDKADAEGHEFSLDEPVEEISFDDPA